MLRPASGTASGSAFHPVPERGPSSDRLREDRVTRAARVLRRMGALACALIAVSVVVPLMPGGVAARRRAVRRFCRRLARALALRVEIVGAPHDGPALIAANHVSWIDVCLLGRYGGFGFVAKSEVRRWPLFGALATRLGTCFIDRRNPFACYRSLPELEQGVRGGRVVIFPEGTTTTGTSVARFHGMLFEAAVREAVPVQPVTISYRDPTGRASRAAAFIGDDTLVGSLLRVAAEPFTIVRIVWHAPILGANRRALAYACRARCIEGLAFRGIRPGRADARSAHTADADERVGIVSAA